MLTAQMEGLLRRLRAGIMDRRGTKNLELTSAKEIVAEIELDYPIRFQERRLRNKWELSLAQSIEFIPARNGNNLSKPRTGARVFRKCVVLNIEGDQVTGVGVITRMRVQPISEPFQGQVLNSGKGHKVDRMLDGKWRLQAMGSKTVKLTDRFLQERGWRFDALENLISAL